MPSGIKQALKLRSENKSGKNKYISRQRVEYSMKKFFEKIAKRQYMCMISEWGCPSLFSLEHFKKTCLDPLKRAADQYLSAAIYWRELEVITIDEFQEIQNLWQKVDRYLKRQS